MYSEKLKAVINSHNVRMILMEVGINTYSLHDRIDVSKLTRLNLSMKKVLIERLYENFDSDYIDKYLSISMDSNNFYNGLRKIYHPNRITMRNISEKLGMSPGYLSNTLLNNSGRTSETRRIKLFNRSIMLLKDIYPHWIMPNSVELDEVSKSVNVNKIDVGCKYRNAFRTILTSIDISSQTLTDNPKRNIDLIIHCGANYIPKLDVGDMVTIVDDLTSKFHRVYIEKYINDTNNVSIFRSQLIKFYNKHKLTNSTISTMLGKNENHVNGVLSGGGNYTDERKVDLLNQVVELLLRRFPGWKVPELPSFVIINYDDPVVKEVRKELFDRPEEVEEMVSVKLDVDVNIDEYDHLTDQEVSSDTSIPINHRLVVLQERMEKLKPKYEVVSETTIDGGEGAKYEMVVEGGAATIRVLKSK